MRTTHTYATLKISREAFDDIKERIRKLGPDYWYRYTDCHKMDQNPTVIHFAGEVGLIPDSK